MVWMRMNSDNDTPDLPEAHFSEEEARCLVHSRIEIPFIINRLHKSSPMVTAYMDGSSDFVLSSILAVYPEEGWLIFDVPAQPERAARLAACRLITFTGTDEGVRVKFHVEEPVATTYQGRTALAARLPEMLARLQRREFFRAPCPLTNPPGCVIPYTVQGQRQDIELTVLDISLGGVALKERKTQTVFENGTVYAGCVLTLPGEGEFVSALEVRNTHRTTLANGTVATRIGFRYIDPPADAISRVQRYIMKLESQRTRRL